MFYNLNLLCICIVLLYTKVRIKPNNLLKSLFSFDFYAFTLPYRRLIKAKTTILQFNFPLIERSN